MGLDWGDVGRIGLGVATGGLSEVPGLVDKYVTKGSEAASKAGAAQKKAMDAAMERLKAGSADQYANRMKDLQQTMAFYGPAQRYLESIYGGSATGPMPLASGPPGMGAGPPGMGGAPPRPPGFPRPQGPPTPMTYGQGPRRGF